MKAKSKLKSKRDNETPEKYLADENQRNLLNGDKDNSNESYFDLKITEENLQEFYKNLTPESSFAASMANITVRYPIPPANLKKPTQKIFILKKAPNFVTAVPSGLLLDQNNLKFDVHNRPVQHSILGSVDEYFKMSLNKEKLTLNEIPSEYHHTLGHGPVRRPFSVMFPANMGRRESTSLTCRERIDGQNLRKLGDDSDTKALKLWQQKMMERKKLQNHISKKIDRVPEKLVFNTGNEYREILENRYLVSRSSPFLGPGYGYRVGSEFWQQNEVVGTNSSNCIHMTNTQTERGYPPPITNVRIADKIKEEKGILIHESRIGGKKSNYETNRLRELNDVIFELHPHQPESENLIVLGNAYIQSNTKKNDVDPFPDIIDNTKVEDSSEVNLSRFQTMVESERSSQLEFAPCLFINSIILNGKSIESPKCSSKIDIRLLFNGYSNEKVTETLNFQNRGTSVIRYWWKKLDYYDPFNLENKNVRRFYFNTEDGILLPNEDLNFPIVFKSEKSGVYHEMWKIEMLPVLTEDKDIVVTLKGVTLQKDLLAITRQNIDNYLKFQMAENISRSIVDEIIDNICFKTPEACEEELNIDIDKEQFIRQNIGMTFDIDSIQPLKMLNVELGEKETEEYMDWEMDCGILRRNIMASISLSEIKKEEMAQKFYKLMDESMIPTSKIEITRLDLLYRIGYRGLLDFFSEMVDSLVEMKRFHEIPETEIPSSSENARASLSQKRGSNSSQNSKKRAPTHKTKGKEARKSLRDSVDVKVHEPDENQIIDDTVASETGRLSRCSSDVNTHKYHSKSHQIVYSLLDKTLDNIINSWNEVAFN